MIEPEKTRQINYDVIARLINTSIDDMKSSLNFYDMRNEEQVQIVRAGFYTCSLRGEKTKAKILERWLKKAKVVQNSPHPLPLPERRGEQSKELR